MTRFFIFIFILFLGGRSGTCFGRYSSPPFNYSATVKNPAVLGFMFKKFVLNVNRFNSQDGVQDETDTIDGGVLVKNQLSYKVGGQNIMSALKLNNWGFQVFYGPREETKVIPLKTSNTYYKAEGKDMRFHLGYRWSRSLSFGVNYNKWTDQIKGGSTSGGSDLFEYKENLIKMGVGSTYRFREVIFLGAGANLVTSGGDEKVPLNWQESYASLSYAQAFYSFVIRLEASYIMTPEAKEKATSTKNLNHQRQSKDLNVAGELKFNQLVPYTDNLFVSFNYSSKTETGLNSGVEKKATTMKGGLGLGKGKFILGASLENVEAEEGTRKQKFSTLGIYLTYGI